MQKKHPIFTSIFVYFCRFWYENPGIFTPDQLVEIKKHTLARVICDSGDDIQEIQNDVFKSATYPESYMSCDHIPSMNMSAWLDINGNGNECANS